MFDILYVDDESALLQMGKLFLERSGQLDVEVTKSGKAALALLQAKAYDAIISDYQMPEMDGIELLKTIRESGNMVPFIIFTGRGREEVVIEAINSGADFYLQKGGAPTAQFAELEHKVRLAVQHRRAEQRVHEHERREAEIINFLPDATFAIDNNGVVIAWNRAMEKLTSISPAHMLGKGNYEYALSVYGKRRPILIDLVLRDDPAAKEWYPSLKREGNTLFAETTSPHLYNGRGATIWFTATPLYDTKGKVIGAIESIRDTTDRKRAEEELREASERYRSFIAVSHTGAWEYNHDTGYLWCSPEYFSMLGRDAATFDLSGAPNLESTWLNLVHPEDRERAGTQFREYLESGSNGIYENHFRMQHLDGHWVWIWSRGSTLRDTKGALTNKTVGTHIDVTGRVHAKDRIIENEHRLALVIAAIPDLIFILSRDGVYLQVSAADPGILALPLDSLIGKNLMDTGFPMDTARFITEALHKAIDTKETQQISYQLAVPLGLLTFEARLVALNDSEVLCIVRDITERRRVEEALRESEERFRFLAENMADIVWTLDRDLKLTYVSPSIKKVLGYTPEERMQKPLSTLMTPESYRRAMAILAREKQRDEEGIDDPDRRVTFEIEYYHADGHIVLMENGVRAFRDGNGAFRGLYGSSRDITDQRHAEELIRGQRDLALALSTAMERNEALKYCLETAILVSGMDCGGIYLVDQVTGSLDLIHYIGLPPGFISSSSHFEAGSPQARLISTGEPAYSTHTALGVPVSGDRKGEALTAVAIVPVRHRKRVIACLNVASHRLPEVPPYARTALEVLSAQIASTLASKLV